jgi:hypothetical protein
MGTLQSLQLHDHSATLVRSARVIRNKKTKPKRWRLTQPQTRFRYDPIAMGYLTTAAFAWTTNLSHLTPMIVAKPTQ